MKYIIIWHDGNGFRQDSIENDAVGDEETAREAFLQDMQEEYQAMPDIIAVVAHEEEVQVTLTEVDF